MPRNTAATGPVLVTGASTGIGRACALELDRLGFMVFAGVRTEAAAQDLRSVASPRLRPLMLDVTQSGSIAEAAAAIADSVGAAGLVGLVNNAGIAVPGPLETVPIDALRRQLEVNVVGQVAVTQAMLPLLRRAKGRVVNISSISGGLAVPGLGAYSASKFALEAVTDALRLELRARGISVSAIEPGAVDTPIWRKAAVSVEKLPSTVAPEVLALYQADLIAMREAVDVAAREAVPVDCVVRAVVHALLSARPKAHYYLGLKTRLAFKGLRLLPDPLRDWLVRRLVGMP